MMDNNYYLNLLYKKVMELKNVLNNIDDSNYTIEQKKYLISGYIITLDSILEIGISDLHSSRLDELTSLIYYTRQKAVHYGYFNGIHNIEDVASKIIDLTETLYKDEKNFYSSLLSLDNFNTDENNIVIKNSSNITSSQHFYKFKNNDGSQELWIPSKNVFTLTKKCKEKIANYIISLNNTAYLYDISGEEKISYKEIDGVKTEEFLRENYFVTEENYQKHNQTISGIIKSFNEDPINTIQIMEYASNEQFCRNTIDVIKEFVLERTMFDAYTEHYHLIKDKYSLNKMQKTDYTKLQHDFKKNVLQYTTQKDAFFIDATIKRTNFYFNNVISNSEDDEVPPEILCPILIQLFEIGPKQFSNQFISSSPEFKKCYTNLLRYRQVFSHYLLSNKEYKDTVSKFKNEFLNFVKILETINLEEVKINVHENYETYSLIERDKSDFFNYKHEQYLRISENKYIGKKIHYSSKNPKSNKLIAIIPYGNSAANTLYYEKDANDYLIPTLCYDEKSGKTTYIPVSKQALGETKEVKIDFNLSYLFKAYSMLKKVKSNNEILIHFHPSEENNRYNHYDSLENVILRFFIQGYLPIELLRKINLNTTNASQGIISLTDEKGNLIADIINKKKYSMIMDSTKDDKRFFSRIDDINHNFNKRRHTKC